MRKDEAYSDETARSVRWTIDRLVDRFLASAEHATLAKAHQPSVRSILQLTADVCYNYQLERPTQWTLLGLGEVLGHWMPHKVMAPESYFTAVEPVLLAFVRWGLAERVWGDRLMAEETAFIVEACRRLTKKARAPAHPASVDVVDEPQPRRQNKRSVISKPNGKVYQLRISLKEITPEIWRQVEVADITLAKLHGVIQYGMGWKNCHLHMYHTPQGRFTDPKFGLAEEEWCADVGDSRRIRLGDLLAAPGDSFGYEYDFGDSWHHLITCEAIREPTPGERYPVKSRCVAGARACPPEDVGSASGYEELLRVLADPNDEEHEHMVGWSLQPRDRPYDPEYFDLELANRLIAP
jgi:hypothetical protein